MIPQHSQLQKENLESQNDEKVATQTNNLWPRITTPGAFTLIAGPCVIESEELCLEVARFLKPVCERLGIVYIFKASYNKANRTSGQSFRGLESYVALEILRRVRTECGIPTITDVHERGDVHDVVRCSECDILQIPALLSRQTDLLLTAASTGKILNIKKGQFSSPHEMVHVIKKAGHGRVILTERGTTFGYNNLVADFRSILIMKSFGVPVLFDATHSVQLPGANGNCSGGQREYAPVLARAAAAAGADGLFIETHPDPDKALSDGPNMICLEDMPALLDQCMRIRKAL